MFVCLSKLHYWTINVNTKNIIWGKVLRDMVFRNLFIDKSRTLMFP